MSVWAICGCIEEVIFVESVAAQTEQIRSDLSGRDIYYQTEGHPVGLSVEDVPSEYPRYGFIDNRLLIWVVTQQHTYFGGFVLALPLFSLLLEFWGMSRRDCHIAQKYDGLARDILRVALLALSVTAMFRVSHVVVLLSFSYPSFMTYMGSTFRNMMPLYAVMFLGESLLLILYYYSWERLAEHWA